MFCAACTTPEQLEAAIKNPGVLAPMFEFRLRTFDLPLDQQDLSWLSTEIRPFRIEESVTAPAIVGRSTNSKNMNQPEFTLPTDFIALGVCALAYVEPYGMGVDGNFFGTQAQVDLLQQDLLSPDVLFDAQGAFLDGQAPQYVIGQMCPAHLDYGHATWKFADWLFKSYRMAISCQMSSTTHEILNERMIDMGNCCSDSSKEGFSATAGSYIEATKAINERLRAMVATPALLPAAPTGSGLTTLTAANMGYFQPLNAEAIIGTLNNGQTGPLLQTKAARLRCLAQAFGGVQSSGPGTKWFKFDVPTVIRANRNIKISLQSLPEDQPNYMRMLREAMLRVCQPLTNIGGTATGTNLGSNRIVVGDMSYTAYARSAMARIPGGRVHIGIGLKGLALDNSLCNSIESIFEKMTPQEAFRSLGWTRGVAVGSEAQTLPLSTLFGGSGGLCGGGCK